MRISYLCHSHEIWEAIARSRNSQKPARWINCYVKRRYSQSLRISYLHNRHEIWEGVMAPRILQHRSKKRDFAKKCARVHRSEGFSALYRAKTPLFDEIQCTWLVAFLNTASPGCSKRRVMRWKHIWRACSPVNESCHTCEEIWMSRVMHVNESCHICKWVMSHVRSTCRWVMWHMWMSHVTRVNESWPMRERRVMRWQHIWRACSCVNESCHTCEELWMSHVMRRDE